MTEQEKLMGTLEEAVVSGADLRVRHASNVFSQGGRVYTLAMKLVDDLTAAYGAEREDVLAAVQHCVENGQVLVLVDPDDVNLPLGIRAAVL